MASTQPRKRRTIGAFDIRVVIGALLGIYGIVLFFLGIFNATDAELDRADGMNVNLWAGLGMIIVAAAMGLWAWTRPIVVPADEEE